MRNPASTNSLVNTQKQALRIEFDRVLGMVLVGWQRETHPDELLDFSK